jgi:effector-binding domain-containing protein
MSYPEVKFKTAPKMTVASIERKGPYYEIGATMQRLKGWIDSKGIEQAGYPFCLFYDNPTETPEGDLRSDVCIPVGGPFQAEGEITQKEFAEALVAETRHTGPPEDFAKTYGPFLEGLLKEGYSLAGPAREFFLTVSEVKGPGTGFLIQQPIQKKPA